jgi:F0F1-type ATP synthase assembly protein I
MKSGKRQVLEAMSFAGNMGFIMAVNAAVGLLLGKGIDKWMDSSPWGVGLGVAFGMIAGLRAVFRRAAELGGGDEKKNQNSS